MRMVERLGFDSDFHQLFVVTGQLDLDQVDAFDRQGELLRSQCQFRLRDFATQDHGPVRAGHLDRALPQPGIAEQCPAHLSHQRDIGERGRE